MDEYSILKSILEIESAGETSDTKLEVMKRIEKDFIKNSGGIPIMKSIPAMLDSMRTKAAIYESLILDRIFAMSKNGIGIHVFPERAKTPEVAHAAIQLQQLASRDVFMVYFVLCVAYASHIGPKVYRPTLTECLSLENTSASLPKSDYNQPFPIMIVEFPPEYSQLLEAKSRIKADSEITVPARPVGMFLTKTDTLLRFFCVFAYPGLNFGHTLLHYMDTQVNPEQPIDECIGETVGKIMEHTHANFYTESDGETMKRALTMCINAMLLLTDYGQHLGYAQPQYAERLKRLCEKKNKHQAANQRELKSLANLYGFSQSIQFDGGCRGITSEGITNGHAISPHWRRGHIRQQAHGPQLSLRKRIFIPPVLVNREQFLGKLCNTKTAYQTGQTGEGK